MSVITRIFALLPVLFSFNVLAADIDPLTAVPDMIYLDQADGFVTNVPVTGTNDLLGKVQHLKSELQEHKMQAAIQVETSKFSGQDALITVLMPGGIIYAANKKQRHQDAQAQLADVTQQLDNLESDLTMLKSATSKQTLAMLY
ncbi:MAG: hypothetical protein ABW131_08795 [Candidatus Sedimenticola sp. 6PFRAG5]